jgi:hypothetical protein
MGRGCVNTQQCFESPVVPTDADAAESAPSDESIELDADESADGSSEDDPERRPTIANTSADLGFEVLLEP